jgi:hypothetical protein
MKRILATALLAASALAHAQGASAPTSPAKKALVDKVLQLQQPAVEQFARNLLQQPAMRMMQEAGVAIQRQIAPDKRQDVGRQVETEIKKFLDEAGPLVRDRALKIAPGVIGPVLEEKFTEDELKQVIGWLESPVIKKYQTALGPEVQQAFVQKLAADSAPVVDPKLQALDARLRVLLGVPPASAASGPAGGNATATPRPTPAAAAKPAAPKASGK